MKAFNYPIDTDQFQAIREQNLLYVDKTDLMFELANHYRYVFLARPRRFGKSLLCNTLKAYFQGQKDLFTGLAIDKLETAWKHYPVLHFTMSGLKNLTVLEAKSKLEGFLRDYEEVYGRKETDVSPRARFRSLIHNATMQTGEKVVVILDEYDAPIMRLLNTRHQLTEMRMMLGEFYQVLKDDGAYLRFVFITGVTKFSQLSIFSELNNLYHISLLDRYSGICGFTQTELDTVLRPCIEDYAHHRNLSVQEAYALLKRNYDGYRFSPNGQEVYAPFSLLRALHDHSEGHYWFETGTSSSLLEYLRHYPLSLPLDYDGIAVSEDEFNIPCEDADTPMPLLYQSGYLTIASYNPLLMRYVLKIPNNEVRKGLISCLMPILLKRKTAENNSLAAEMAQALMDGELPDALIALRAYIAKIPYDIISKEKWQDKESREGFYKLLFYMVFSMLNALVDTEVKSILGRADVVIQQKHHVFVLELKVDDTVDHALAQIDSKGYAIPYEASGRNVIKAGICISSKARNITHWRLTDATGNILDERIF